MEGPLLIFALAGGILTIFTFLIATWKLFRFIFKVDQALPILLSIAHEFQNNSGSTLKDKIDKLDEKITYQQSENRLAVRLAEDSRLVANTNAAIVTELSKAQSEDLRHIKEYLHDQVHGIKNELNAVTMQLGVNELHTERIEERLDNMMPYVIRHRETDNR